MASCIDEYDLKVKNLDQEIYVFDGDICSNKWCDIYVSRVLGLDTNPQEEGIPTLERLQVTIQGSDGSVYKSPIVSGNHVNFYVGTLHEDVNYEVYVKIDNNVFKSNELKPLFTEGIDSVTYRVDEDKESVFVLINTKSSSTSTEEKYFKWKYVEDWQIKAPCKQLYYYDDDYANIFVFRGRDVSVGYGHCEEHKPTIGSNLNYGKGAIQNMAMYSYKCTDDRFQTLYRTRVTQYAISKQEYEYLKSTENYTDGMGGLFTPQPALLESNFECYIFNGEDILNKEVKGAPKLAGIVGLRGNCSTYDRYITRTQAKYVNTHKVKIITDDEARELGMTCWGDIYACGYWVYSYQDNPPAAKWAKRWCFDVTDPVWGASLIKPSDWPNNIY